MCFFNSTSGLEPGELCIGDRVIISRARCLRVFWFKGILGVVGKSLLEKEGSRARSTLKELVSYEFESEG